MSKIVGFLLTKLVTAQFTAKVLVILLKAIADRTDNEVDNRIVEQIEIALEKK